MLCALLAAALASGVSAKNTVDTGFLPKIIVVLKEDVNVDEFPIQQLGELPHVLRANLLKNLKIINIEQRTQETAEV